MISTDAVIVAVGNLATADLDGEAVLLDVDTGYYYGLNETGASIMDLIETPISVKAIMDSLFQEYEVGLEQLEHDVMTFLQAMEDRQLIRIINGAVT